jgi:hypothetical protein
VNNDFLVKLAMSRFFYDNKSVNENMHVRIAFEEILQEDDCNVFECFLCPIFP